jgi:hypothetical protein
MDTRTKLDTATQKKETGDQAFKMGEMSSALRFYHEALMYLQGLDKNALASIGIKAPLPPPISKEGASKDSDEKKEKTIVRFIVLRDWSKYTDTQVLRFTRLVGTDR